VVYSDAFWRRGDLIKKAAAHRPEALQDVFDNGWGAIQLREGVRPGASLSPDLTGTGHGQGLFSAGSFSQEVVVAFAPSHAYIYFLELAGLIMAAIHPPLPPGRVVFFIDNEAAKCALIKGYGACTPVNHLVATFWNMMQLLQVDPWFARVDTHCNPADSVSRRDLSLVQSLHMSQVHTDFSAIEACIKRIAHDEEYALGDAAGDLLTAANQPWSTPVRTG